MAYTYVQSASNTGVLTDLTAVFVSNLTNPSLIIVGIELSVASGSISTISDSASHTFSLADGGRSNTNGWTNFVYYALNTSTTATNSVTVTSPNQVRRIAIFEYTGLALSSPLGAHTGQNGTSTSPSSGNITTTRADSLIFGWLFTLGGTITAGSGFTQRNTADGFVSGEDKGGGAAGSTVAATWSTGSTFGTDYTAQVVEFMLPVTSTFPGYISPFGWH